MDPHFREYLAAVAGMQDLYGFNDDHADGVAVNFLIEPAQEAVSGSGDATPAVIGGR